MTSYTYRRRTAAALTLVLAALTAPVFAQLTPKTSATPVVTTEQVRAELMAYAPDGAETGKTVWVGLQIAHQPEWHTYWKNSGDSGLPTVLQWTLPAGVSAGEIAWPIPKKIPIGNLANYGYDGKVLLPVPLNISPAFRPAVLSSDIEIKLKAAWLVCRKECVPEEGEFALRLPIKGSTALNAADFAAALKAQPKALNPGSGSANIEASDLKFSLTGLPAAWRGKTLDFFPETPEVIETAAAGQQSWSSDTWSVRVPISAQRLNSPALMPLVVALGQEGLRAELKVAGNWPALSTGAATANPPATASPALGMAARTLDPTSAEPPPVSIGLWAALAGALLGGLILNLMPCVFPVLAIKVLSFTQHAQDRRHHRVSGLAYSVGVVLSFVALGALMLGLRAAGESLGWGFQLQSPWVVAGMAALFTVLGLNLVGMFEFGQMLPSSVASLQARHPVVDSLLTGVLAVAIASPCTAPFMGASLGLAMSLPTMQALLVFAALGLGMAMPYLAASLIPALAQALPRPGAWMDTFRKLMAFPMFATVVWLVWVLGQQSGIDGAGALLALLVSLSAVVWTLTLSGRTRTVLAAVAVALLLLLAQSLGPHVGRQITGGTTAAEQGERWQPWKPEAVTQALAQGSPVFVDFTAAWCVTCQYNKKTTLADAQLLSEFDARRVKFFRADWTRRDPTITRALAALGRNGVPVYVLQAPGRKPVVLSEVLSVDEVRAALNTL